jgi:hypothetical protein
MRDLFHAEVAHPVEGLPGQVVGQGADEHAGDDQRRDLPEQQALADRVHATATSL